MVAPGLMERRSERGSIVGGAAGGEGLGAGPILASGEAAVGERLQPRRRRADRDVREPADIAESDELAEHPASGQRERVFLASQR
jgi:hypothetical protein